MRLFFFLMLMMIAASPAGAQDMLRQHREGDPMAELFGDGPAPRTIADYANLYNNSCTTSNVDKTIDEYVATQCACTSLKMLDFMSADDMQVLFTKSKEGDFQQARVMLLAYIPCMYDSVYNFVFDGCFYDNDIRRRLMDERKVCQCYGRYMGNYAASKGDKLVPGFTRNEFRSDKAVPNPFAYIIKSDFFSEKADMVFEGCMMTEERNLDK